MTTDRKDPGFDKEVTAAESPSARMKRIHLQKPRLMDHSERLAAYGSPAKIENGRLVPDAAWERFNIVVINVPWPGGTTKALRVHKLTVHKWTVLFQRWHEAGLLKHLKTFGGAHNCRLKRGKEKSTNLKDLSTHAFGAAADFNVVWNQFGAEPAKRGEPGSLIELVPIAYDCGLVWGGDWSKPDGQHFEIGVAK